MSALVELYVREVTSGNMKIAEVPPRLRAAVEAAIGAAANTQENGGGRMRSAVFIILVRIFFGKEVAEMLVRLYAGEVILDKITVDDVPRGLRERVSAYLVEMGYMDAQ